MTRRTHSLVLILALNLASFSLGKPPQEAEKEAAPKTDSQGARQDQAIRKKLQKYIARFNDKSKWHYGERKAGELAGKWISGKDATSLVVFGADGSFSQNFNGKMTTGLYGISDNGLVVTYSMGPSVNGLGSWYKLDGKTLTGPRGPKPNAIWKRAPK